MIAALILRAAPLALIYAVLTGPGTPANWGVGAVVGLCLAVSALLSGRRASPASLLRALLLPWFALGMLLRIARGTAQTLPLLIRRDRARPGFVTCDAGDRTEAGRALLALVESASPGSALAAIEAERLTIGVIDASAPEDQCADIARWQRRFQRPMLR